MKIVMLQKIVVYIILQLTVSSLAQYLSSGPIPGTQYHHEIIYQSPDISASSLNPFLQAYDAGNRIAQPARFAGNLFTPNTVQQPAETPGQFENYMKALEEEAKEREMERTQNYLDNTQYINNNGFDRTQIPNANSKSFVDVKVEGSHKYGYTI